MALGAPSCEERKTQAKHWRPSLRKPEDGMSIFCVFLGQLVLGLASGLEAFSREPPCDSIGALAFQQTPETSGMAWEFLSYYPKLPSRCLRDRLSYLVNWEKKSPVTGEGVPSFFFLNPGHTPPSSTALRRSNRNPRTIALRNYHSRNSQLSRVKPTCLTTV